MVVPRRKGKRMKAETEIALRGILQLDPEIDKADAERAIDLLCGRKKEDAEPVQVIRRKDAMKWLGVHRRTLDYYIEKGYLDRVYGGGERAIGISRESYLRFTTSRRTLAVRK